MLTYFFPLILVSLHSLIYMSSGQLVNENDGVNSKADECTSPSDDTGLYEKVSPSSKYMIYRSFYIDDNIFNREEASQICSKVAGLEMADITSDVDLASLERYLKTEVWVGLHRVQVDTGVGSFEYGSGEPMQYQAFVGIEPDNRRGTQDCVKLNPTDGYITMADEECSYEAGVLCQFQQGTSCFLQSTEEITPKAEDGLVSLGDGGEFYISNTQKPWAEAHQYCLSQGYHLITTYDDQVTKQLGMDAQNWLSSHHFFPTTQFWTSGMFTSTDYKDMRWMIGEDVTEPINDISEFHWAAANTQDQEPFDQTESGFEICVDTSFEGDGNPNSPLVPYFRASHCRIPKFFICHQMNVGVLPEVLNVTNGTSPDDVVPTTCSAETIDPVQYEIDMNKPTDEDDIVKFMIFNVEHDLKSGIVPIQVKDEIKYKENVVNALVELTKKSVSSDYVDHGLLNVVRVINLVYLNALANENDTLSAPIWEHKYVKFLQNCLTKATLLPVAGSGFEIKVVDVGSNNEQVITVPEEYADGFDHLDNGIDMLWYMFSLSHAVCYPFITGNKISFAAEYHVQFLTDFMKPLRKKWIANVQSKEDKTGLDYTLALGDVDFPQSYRNLRFLVSGAYTKNDLENMELVRPLDTSMIHEDIVLRTNKHTGGNWDN